MQSLPFWPSTPCYRNGAHTPRGLACVTADDLRCEEVRNAEELRLSSATKELPATTMLDGQPVGNGLPGPSAPNSPRATPPPAKPPKLTSSHYDHTHHRTHRSAQRVAD